MLTAPAPVAPVAEHPLSGRAGRALVAAALLVCAVGLLVGLLAGPLWLDETISVEIARRPLPELYAALRRDGAPPLYYLLLHAWTAAVGTGTVAVRLLTVLVVPLALWLAWRLGRRLGGVAGGRAALVVTAALPWTIRYGSETRMYLFVVALSLAGALALLRVRSAPGRGPLLALAACCAALLLTHYWSLFLLAVVGAAHLPGLVRRDPGAVRVVVALVLAGVAFLPWLPTFLFQAANTGAPWADPPGVGALLSTPQYWGGGPTWGRALLASMLVPLALLAVRRGPPQVRPVLGVVLGTLLLAWTQTALLGGAYTGRYTAVVVALFTVSAGLGAVALPGRWPVLALAAVVLVGGFTGIRAVTYPRTTADVIAQEFRAEAQPGDVLVFCPDQLGPPVAREIGPGYEQLTYPALGPPQLVDWVGYTERHDAASPVELAARLDELAGERQLFVLKASGYRTLEADDGSSDSGDDCDQLLEEVRDLRGSGERLFGRPRGTGQVLVRFDGRS